MDENKWVWDFISSGPTNNSYRGLDLKNTDEFVSTFAWEWFSAIQSLMNCSELLDKLVKQEKIDMYGVIELKGTLGAIYSSGDAIEQSFNGLMAFKKGMLLIKKIREDFGTINKYESLSDEEKLSWLEENGEN